MGVCRVLEKDVVECKFETVMFDLDDTILDRGKAVDNMFSFIAKTFYSNVVTDEMRLFFIKHDNRGYSNKIDVMNSLFDKFPPTSRLPSSEIYDFWDSHFPLGFSLSEEEINTLKKITANAKTAIITNGRTKGQKLKIEKTGLDKIFDTIIISEEVGIEKPDAQIFNLALKRLGVSNDKALFVGDNLKNDIKGGQNANIKTAWYNPEKVINNTGIVPFLEVCCLSEVLGFINA